MTGPGENTYCRRCGVRAEPGQVVCANCGAELPITSNTVRTDAMAPPPQRASQGGRAPVLALAGLGLAGIGLAAAGTALLAARRLRR